MKATIAQRILNQGNCDGIVCKECPLFSYSEECNSCINDSVKEDIIIWLQEEEERINCAVQVIKKKGKCNCHDCNDRHTRAVVYLIKRLGEQKAKELIVEELI